MADRKISELSVGTTPLAGTELVEIVQGGDNVQVPASAFGSPIETLVVPLAALSAGTFHSFSSAGHGDFSADGDVDGTDVSWVESGQEFVFHTAGKYRVSVRALIDPSGESNNWPNSLSLFGVLVNNNPIGRHSRFQDATPWTGIEYGNSSQWTDETFITVAEDATLEVRVFAQNYSSFPTFEYSVVVSIQRIVEPS